MRSVISIIGILCFVLAASVGESAETVKVAAIFAKTGKAAGVGSGFFQAARFSVEEINHQGGLLGKQIELIEFDNKTTPLDSKLAAVKAVKAGVIAVIGASWSSNSLAMAPVLQAAGIPMISPDSTNPDVTLAGNYIFRVCFVDSFQGRVMADFAIRDLKAKTAVVLTNANSSYSLGLAKVFIQHFREQKGKIAWEGDYLDEEADFSFLLEKIKTIKPDAVFLPGYRRDSALIMKQARKMGLSVTFLGGDGWDEDMYNYVKEELHGNYYSSHWNREVSDRTSREFVERYEKKHGEVNPSHALGYDAVSLLADAIRRVESSEPAKIRDAVASTNKFQGVTGNITLDRNGDPVKPAVILKFDKGTIVYVRTAQP
ncbi:ABC transporter substrate-binding protein [Desulfococcaceae bacterium HSG8]|nr:ABC transporter substrate-binding protein [Desulfococcaceae bacterium HSG8]